MSATVQVPAGNVDLVLKWTKSNCPNFITVSGSITSNGPVYDFYFVPNTPDILLFVLQWGGTVVDLDW